METFLKELPQYFSIATIFPTIAFICIKIRNNSQFFMPSEYKVIRNIINKIASKNHLGEYPLTFTIVAGSRTYWIAKGLGICQKEESCYFIKNINPFVPYRGRLSEELNEAIRQSYLLNTIEAYAWSNGTIAISRSSFKNNERKEDYLAFVIGHEISHILNKDSFNNSLKKDKEGEGLKPKKKELLGFKLSRKSESKADINSAKMLINAGYKKDVPLKAHDFIAKIGGYGYITDKKSSHPGYEERRNKLKSFLEKHNYDKSIESPKANTLGNWIFNRKENTLTFRIKSSKKIEALDKDIKKGNSDLVDIQTINN